MSAIWSYAGSADHCDMSPTKPALPREDCRWIGRELLLSVGQVKPNHRLYAVRLLIVTMALTAFAVHPNEIVDPRTYVACSVGTMIDDFTDIASHHLTCTQSLLSPWNGDLVTVSCTEGSWRVVLKPAEAIFHTDDRIAVKYRFDRLSVLEDEWLWWRKGRFAYRRGTAAPVEFLDAVALAYRLVFQVGDERGRVEFGAADARAVDELKRRCGLAALQQIGVPVSSRGATADTLAAIDQSLASAASAAHSGGSNGPGAGAGAPGLVGQGYGSAGAGEFAWDDPGAGCEVLKNPDPNTKGILGEGMTYRIKVRFRVDPSGLVTSAQITEGSGNSSLDAAVLTAARQMSFACKAEAHGVKSYEVS